eukprot:Pompholyxophrys_punicea_v1_NODE_140_length_3249_cov_4.736068.p1 type:complete len:271 gc:universal NODE_140_length_3249_cov_4.736068:2360-1548(-)
MVRKAACLIKETCSADTKGQKTAGWIADELEIRAGLVHRNGGLIGLVDGFVAEKDVSDHRHDWNPPVARARLATHVLQVFIASTDGSICLPLGFLPTRTMNGKDLVPVVQNWISQFQKETVVLAWGATDGIRSNQTFFSKMQKTNPTYLHFFDYVHVLKNFRNLICNRVVKTPDCPGGFHMTDLVAARLRNPQIKKFLPYEPNPTDKMDMANVHTIAHTRQEFHDELSKEQEPACVTRSAQIFFNYEKNSLLVSMTLITLLTPNSNILKK